MTSLAAPPLSMTSLPKTKVSASLRWANSKTCTDWNGNELSAATSPPVAEQSADVGASGGVNTETSTGKQPVDDSSAALPVPAPGADEVRPASRAATLTTGAPRRRRAIHAFFDMLLAGLFGGIGRLLSGLFRRKPKT